MKIILIILISVLLLNCSFDNKSGIWKNENEIEVEKNERFRDFETLYIEEKSFIEKIDAPKNFFIEPSTNKVNINWTDEFYQNSNNLDNFSYKNLNEQIFKSEKLSKYKIYDKILFDRNNIIISDNKGNINIYDVNQQKIIFKFNFYKKRIKKIKIKLKIIVEKNILYVADNLGYLYAIDYYNAKLIWAKNYKKPFRSNLKIYKEKILLADQDNSIYIIDKFNGNKIKTIPTEEVTLKNNFINSLALDNEKLFYLNTFGSLYSLNSDENKFNWFINLNQSLDPNTSNLFFSNPIIQFKNHIIVSTDPYLYIVNKYNGSTKIKKSITSIVQPISIQNKLFLITKDDLLVCLDVNTGKVDYSVDINQKISNFLESKNNKSIQIKSLSIVNNNLFIFLKNSYLVKFDMIGKILNIEKLPSKLNSFPIFINNSILYLDNKNKLVIIN